MATEIDFKVGNIGTDAELMSLLATSDYLEMKLRRLASLIYESNHGDSHGAAAMLAVATPGDKKDLAPTWLINEVTALSKSDHQRTERVSHKPRGGGLGVARGGGRGGRGRGDDDGSAENGRGRGRGRRGGGRGRDA
jgi:hypothetical protein